MKPPAFQFYVDNFIEGTVDMTDAELGLYIRWLCAQWNRGGLPDDDQELARFSRGQSKTDLKRTIARIKIKFEKKSDGLLKNNRMEIERIKQIEYRENRSKSGILGNAMRWHSDNTAIANPIAKHRSPSSTPSPISNKGEEDAPPSKLNGVEQVTFSREFERVVERMDTINRTYSDTQSWCDEDKAEYSKLKARKKELKAMLGVTI